MESSAWHRQLSDKHTISVLRVSLQLGEVSTSRDNTLTRARPSPSSSSSKSRGLLRSQSARGNSESKRLGEAVLVPNIAQGMRKLLFGHRDGTAYVRPGYCKAKANGGLRQCVGTRHHDHDKA
eukprot:399017-Rhodomonas_salina.1